MTVKKAELHVHLEGTTSPVMAKKLARKNNISLPNTLFNHDGQSYYFRDFKDFLQVYDTLSTVIKMPQDYYDVTFDYLRSLAADGAIYSELSYSPNHAESNSDIPSIEHLHAIQQAIDDSQDQFGIIGRIIIMAVRHYGVDACEQVAKATHHDIIPAMVGFSLAGNEVDFPPKLFKKAFEIAADAGLGCTVHTGEHAPASRMIEAIENLPIQRIGHGVRAIDSPKTIELIIEHNLTLEVCPSSNISLGAYSSLEQHPLPKLMDAGIKLCLNTDDPPFFGTTLGEEYKRVQTAYRYTDKVMTNITAMAIEAAFVDQATKKNLKKQLQSS